MTLFSFESIYSRKKGTDHPKAAVVCVAILVFERFWVVSPFFTPVSFFITYPARQLFFEKVYFANYPRILVDAQRFNLMGAELQIEGFIKVRKMQTRFS